MFVLLFCAVLLLNVTSHFLRPSRSTYKAPCTCSCALKRLFSFLCDLILCLLKWIIFLHLLLLLLLFSAEIARSNMGFIICHCGFLLDISSLRRTHTVHCSFIFFRYLSLWETLSLSIFLIYMFIWILLQLNLKWYNVLSLRLPLRFLSTSPNHWRTTSPKLISNLMKKVLYSGFVVRLRQQISCFPVWRDEWSLWSTIRLLLILSWRKCTFNRIMLMRENCLRRDFNCWRLLFMKKFYVWWFDVWLIDGRSCLI